MVELSQRWHASRFELDWYRVAKESVYEYIYGSADMIFMCICESLCPARCRY